MQDVQLRKIRLIPYQVHHADFNMAADEFLLSLPEPVLRLYGWTLPTLSFGKSNFKSAGLNLEIINSPRIAKARRLSGGKTVLHQHELTYAFCCHTDPFPRSILETYRLISQPLGKCLTEFGIPVETQKSDKQAADSTICFKEVSSYEITTAGKKIIGSAQYRRRNRFMQHGAILLDIDWRLWKETWQIPPESHELEDRITTIKSVTGISAPPDSVAAVLTDQFSDFFGAEIRQEDFSAAELQVIETLRPKYQWSGF